MILGTILLSAQLPNNSLFSTQIIPPSLSLRYIREEYPESRDSAETRRRLGGDSGLRTLESPRTSKLEGRPATRIISMGINLNHPSRSCLTYPYKRMEYTQYGYEFRISSSKTKKTVIIHSPRSTRCSNNSY